jgi:periplasmic copper chaperone A
MMSRLQSNTITALVLIASCSAPSTPPQSAKPVAVAGNITISEPRVRLPAQGRKQTAAYLTMTNNGKATDHLISATSPVAGKLELHAHSKTNDGLVLMRQIGDISIEAGVSVPLSPGGFHIMIKDMSVDLKVGQALPMTLTFASGATAHFTAPIVANPKAGDNSPSQGPRGHVH